MKPAGCPFVGGLRESATPHSGGSDSGRAQTGHHHRHHPHETRSARHGHRRGHFIGREWIVQVRFVIRGGLLVRVALVVGLRSRLVELGRRRRKFGFADRVGDDRNGVRILKTVVLDDQQGSSRAAGSGAYPKRVDRAGLGLDRLIEPADVFVVGRGRVGGGVNFLEPHVSDRHRIGSDALEPHVELDRLADVHVAEIDESVVAHDDIVEHHLQTGCGGSVSTAETRKA